MDKPVKISIVVPVYNVEKYLEKCLDSLVSQTLQDIEIVIVNDGSPDNSQKIIDSFASEYPDKIITLQQENKGLGAARNYGVSHSRGQYIGFVDSDDWIEPDMFELLYSKAVEDDSDVVICSYFSVIESTGKCQPVPLWKNSKEITGSVSGFVQLSTSPALAWNKLYKRELIENTPFPDLYYEDIATIPIILSNCKKISFVQKPLYYYLKRQGAITSQRNNPKNLDVIKGWERVLEKANHAFINEIEYAVYVSVSFFLTSKQEHLYDFLEFFWKNEDRFWHNKLIRDDLQNRKLSDLFNFMESSAPANDEQSEYVKNLIDFLEDTYPLISQLDKLTPETLSELYEMYSIAAQSAAEYADCVGPKLVVQLCHKQELIGRYINTDNH